MCFTAVTHKMWIFKIINNVQFGITPLLALVAGLQLLVCTQRNRHVQKGDGGGGALWGLKHMPFSQLMNGALVNWTNSWKDSLKFKGYLFQWEQTTVLSVLSNTHMSRKQASKRWCYANVPIDHANLTWLTLILSALAGLDATAFVCSPCVL